MSLNDVLLETSMTDASNADESSTTAARLVEGHTAYFDGRLFAACESYVRAHRALHQQLADEEWYEKDVRAAAGLFHRVRFLFEHPSRSRLGIGVACLMGVCVLLSVVALVLRSLPQFNPEVEPSMRPVWRGVDTVLTAFFLIELLVHLAVVRDRWGFVKRPAVLADIVALTPVIADFVAAADLAGLQVLRVCRLVVLLQLIPSVGALQDALWHSAKALLAPLVFLASAVVAGATVVYYSERGEYNPVLRRYFVANCTCEATPEYVTGAITCPRIESDFMSIPQAAWWAITTISTTGYGDLAPQCGVGRWTGAVLMVLGMLVGAVPTAVIGSAFALAVQRRSDAQHAVALHRLRRFAGDTVGSDVGDETPAAHFFRFLRQRLDAPSIPLVSPPPHVSMLVDAFLASITCHQRGVASNAFFELERMCGEERLTLNKAVTLSLGTACEDVPLPSTDDGSVGPEHALLEVPPQFTGRGPVLQRREGWLTRVNGHPLSGGGAALEEGDVLSFGTTEHCVEYRVVITEPFVT